MKEVNTQVDKDLESNPEDGDAGKVT